MADIIGTQNGDIRAGTTDADVMKGLGGDDFLRGGGGNDSIFGGDGDDTLIGNEGSDTHDGGAGFDQVDYDGSARNVVVNLAGGFGSGDALGDTFAGIEAARGSQFDDGLFGDAFGNLLDGNFGDDILSGNDGADTLLGGGGNDTLRGGNDSDLLDGGAGADQIFGDAGFDAISYRQSTSRVEINLAAKIGSEGFAEGDTFNGIEAVIGSAFDDELVGDAVSNQLHGGDGRDFIDGGAAGGNDVLFGDGGDDNLSGGIGDDILVGGTGADVMRGGADDDSYIIDNASDIVDESVAGSSGIDKIQSSVAVNLGGAQVRGLVENVDLVGFEDVAAFGNNLDNVFDGNGGDNRIDGLGGDDTMSGSTGNDVYVVRDQGDVVIENANAGVDRIETFISQKLGANVENLMLSGTSDIRGTGNGLDNVLVGNSGKNVLNGGAGDDSLDGGLGRDALTGGKGNDVFGFGTTLSAGNVDVIKDFLANADVIHLNDAVFTALDRGALDTDAFRIGAAAADAEDRIIYNAETGSLSYDANGSAAGGSIEFARLDAGLSLTADDFFVI